jgi:hypothetical protein
MRTGASSIPTNGTRVKFWDKGKALEQLSGHLGLYRDQEPSEKPGGHRLSDLSDEELIERVRDRLARLGPLIEGEPKRSREG